MNLSNTLLDFKKLNKIDIEELLKYGINVYAENRVAQFKTSLRPSYIETETYTAYLVNNILLLQCKNKSILDKSIINDIDLITNTGFTETLIINGDNKKYLKLSNSNRNNLSPTELTLSKQIDLLIKQAKENRRKIKKSEKQHIRNFFKKLFSLNNARSSTHGQLSMTAQELHDLINNIGSSIPEKPISSYKVKESDLSSVNHDANSKNNEIVNDKIDDDISI